MALVGDGVLAVTEGVPQLDGAVTGSGDDLTVVGGEGDRENVVGVADETAGGGAGGELPESQGLVPRGGQSVSTVGGDDLPIPSALIPCNHLCVFCVVFFRVLPECDLHHSTGRSVGTYTVRDDVGVTVERSLGVTVLGLIAGEVPDDQSLVTGSGQEHVGAVAL